MMKKAKVLIFWALILVVVNCLASSQGFSQESLVDEVVIANTTVYMREMTVNELKGYLTRKNLMWPDGARVKVFMFTLWLAQTKDFIWNFFGMLPSQFKRAIDRRVYTGKASPPVYVTDEYGMIEKVSNSDYAIGILPDGLLTKDEDGIHIVTVIF